MHISMGISQSLQLTQHIVMQLPIVQWSLVQAFQNQGWPPKFEPPTFEEEEFAPQPVVARSRIPNFDRLDHLTRMRLVDEANEVFRFGYTRGVDENDGRKKGYYKVPLLRDNNVTRHIEKYQIRVSRAEYERATAMQRAVGEMERIARAVPYYELLLVVTKLLKKDHGVTLTDTVLVSVDRGGRLPCEILVRALDKAGMFSLKVNQGGDGDGLDEDRLAEFASHGTLRGKHVLFVDSTVDSGRQIRALERFFDAEPWRTRLGFRSWSVVGSNEYGKDLAHHRNVNWGVDPDSTFEDKPELMGIDYARGSYVKVVECPSEASRAIRACLFSVPDGWVYTADDIEKQLRRQRKQWEKRQRERRKAHRLEVTAAKSTHRHEIETERRERSEARSRDKSERALERIVQSKRWQELVQAYTGLPSETLPESVPNDATHAFRNILVVGKGSQDLPDASAQFVAESLGPHCSFFAGTPLGNPGAVLKAALASSKISNPEVRLYQPERSRGQDETFGGVPVMFVGPDKDGMRRQMVADAHAVLALGGGTGTLREVLLALDANKPTVLIDGYGPVAGYLLATKRYRKRACLKPCTSLHEAVQTILELSAA